MIPEWYEIPWVIIKRLWIKFAIFILNLFPMNGYIAEIWFDLLSAWPYPDWPNPETK